MGTPAVTILKNRVLDWETNEKKDVTVAKFYRHWDGYPTGHGADIAMALLNASLTERKKYISFDGKKRDKSVLNNRNWCQHFLKELCKQDMDIEFVNADDSIYGDFTYVITGECDNFGGKLDIDNVEYLIRINVKVYCGDEGDELLFDGNGFDYLEWKHLGINE